MADGGLGDLGSLSIPIEGDLGPLLDAFEKAKQAAEEAGAEAAEAFRKHQERIAEEAQEAFAGLGQVQLRLEGLGEQQKLAREAADAFKTMGEVQVAAAQRGEQEWNHLAATIQRAQEAATSGPRRGIQPGATGVFADIARLMDGRSRRAVADLGAIETAAAGASRGFLGLGGSANKLASILGNVTGVGGGNAVILTRILGVVGPLGAAIGATAAAAFGLAKGFRDMATAGERLQAFSVEDQKRVAEAFALNAAKVRDAAKGTNEAQLVPLRKALEDAEAAVAAARKPVEEGASTLGGQAWDNITAFFGRSQETNITAEEAALNDLAIARDNLRAAIDAEAAAKKRADDQKKKDASDREAQDKLKEEKAELDRASASWDTYLEQLQAVGDAKSALWGGEDPAISALRRQADAFDEHGQRLEGSSSQTTQLAGNAWRSVADKIREVIRAMEDLEESRALKGSDDELSRVQEEAVRRTEDANRRLEGLRQTAAERALTEMRAQHARELQEIENSEKLKGDARAKAIQDTKAAQAAEVKALAGEHGRLFGADEQKGGDFLRGWLDDLQKDMAQSDQAGQDLVLRWKGVFIEILEQAEEWGIDLSNEVRGVQQEFQRLDPGGWMPKAPAGDPFKQTIQELQGAQGQVDDFGQESSRVADDLGADFTSSFQQIRTGAQTTGAAFETWADRMIQKLRELAATKATQVSSSSSGSTTRAAKGYHGVVEGRGGVDQNLMTFALTRGEVVDIRTQDQARTAKRQGGGMPPLKFVDQVGVSLEMEEGDMTADGRELVFLIKQSMTRAFRRSGKFRRALETGPTGR